LNAQIGNEYYSAAKGKKSLNEVTNDNGDWLIQFALSHSIIGSTTFKHKNICVTWSIPDRLSWNQMIMYCLIIDICQI